MQEGANPFWGDDWPDVRRLWRLDPAVAHCNHGSFGAVPGPVLDLQERFRRRMAANPMAWFHRELPGLISQARATVARFLGADLDDLALVLNVSAAVSAVTRSLVLHPGDEVLSTNHAYGSVSLALNWLCDRTGATRVVAEVPVESTNDEVVQLVAARCSERTRLLVVDQITSPTARRFPVQKLAALGHEVGAAVLVDGAHAPGMLPVDVPGIGADFWVGNLHKWPCAPAGTGALWVAPHHQEGLLPLVASAGDQTFPACFEWMGTNDLSAWAAAPAALELLGSLGWDRVRAHNETLVRWGQMTVAEALGVPFDQLRHDPGLSLAIVPLPAGLAATREEVQALQGYLARKGVEAQLPGWGGRMTIRLSAHVYNQPSDYERLAAAARNLLAT